MGDPQPGKIGWLAGVVDGDGYICVSNGEEKVFRLFLGVANTDEALIRECREVAGCGTLRIQMPRGTMQKPQWTWRVSGRAAQGVILQLLPYLVESKKRQRAELALQFPCYPKQYGRRLTERDKAERRRVWEELKAVGAARG